MLRALAARVRVPGVTASKTEQSSCGNTSSFVPHQQQRLRAACAGTAATSGSESATHQTAALEGLRLLLELQEQQEQEQGLQPPYGGLAAQL